MIRSCLRCKTISAGARVFLVLRVFFVVFDNPRPTQLITQSVVFTRVTLLKHKYTDNVTDSVFFILWNIPFLLVLALDSKGIIKTLKRYYVATELACVADESKPRYSPSANQRPKACSAPRVLPGFSIRGSDWLLHMTVLSCTVIGRVDLVEPWLRSR